jgi:hypothetical protein
MVADHQGREHQSRVNPSMASDVRFWHKADIPHRADPCPLLRVKRTSGEAAAWFDPTLLTHSGHRWLFSAAMHSPELL